LPRPPIPDPLPQISRLSTTRPKPDDMAACMTRLDRGDQATEGPDVIVVASRDAQVDALDGDDLICV
jgi:hypothetical protein